MPAQSPTRARRAATSADAGDGRRNLVLVHTDPFQERRDFEAIAALVERQAPDIATTVVDNHWPFPGIERQLARRPSLVFSPVALQRFKPERGRVYCGRMLTKLQEAEALQAAKLPVPHSARLAPGFVADPELFGPFALVKPLEGAVSFGQGVQLMRTGRLRFIAPEAYPDGHPGRYFPMVAQRFIDTGPYPSHIRVLTLFGQPLYTALFTLLEPRASLLASDEELERSIVATNGAPRIRALTTVEPDAIDLARRVYEAMPGLPLQGVDMVRDTDGKLWVLEINSTGNAWHFSSTHGFEMRLAFAASAGATSDLSETGRTMMIAQFDALVTAADILVRRTRAAAV